MPNRTNPLHKMSVDNFGALISEDQPIKCIAGGSITADNIVILSAITPGTDIPTCIHATSANTAGHRGLLGVAKSTVSSGEEVMVHRLKILTGLDTTGYTTDGDPVYLGAAGVKQATPGTVPVIVGYVLERSATEGTIVLDPNGTLGGLSTASIQGTKFVTFTINTDAVAASAENPGLILLGGDGVAAPNNDIVRAKFTQDSINERVFYTLERSRNGGAFGKVAPNFAIGSPSETTASIDAVFSMSGTNGGSAIRTMTFTVGSVATTLDYSAQPVNSSIVDNSATAFTVAQGTNNVIGVSTVNNAERITIGQAPSATAPQTGLFIASVGPIVANGIEFGSRYCVTDEFSKRPYLTGDVAANPHLCNMNFEAIGTNATSALSTFAIDGGVTLTTAGAAADQQAIKPHTIAGMTSWAGTNWRPAGAPRMKVNIKPAPSGTVASARMAVGFKLTVAAGAGMIQDATDADQAFFGYSSDNQYTASATNWVACVRIGGVSANVDTGVAVTALTNYQMVIDIDSAGIARFYINQVLVHTSAALTAAAAFIPFAAVQTLAAAAAAKSMTVRRIACSRDLA